MSLTVLGIRNNSAGGSRKEFGQSVGEQSEWGESTLHHSQRLETVKLAHKSSCAANSNLHYCSELGESCTTPAIMRDQNVAMGLVAFGTESDCPGKYQEQCVRQKSKLVLSLVISSCYLATARMQTKYITCPLVLVICRMCESARLLQLLVVRVIRFQ